MTSAETERLAFNVDTGRVLQILASEIYDSPRAFLRENIQNAYDAVLMRCTDEGLEVSDRRIDLTVEPSRIIVRDDGIGMNEEVLRQNFWRAGSSGKKSELARRFWRDRDVWHWCDGKFWGVLVSPSGNSPRGLGIYANYGRP